MQHLPKRKPGPALARRSRSKVDLPSSKISDNDNLPDANWQHLRMARRLGVPIARAKLICSLAGIGGAAND